jgi:molybdopterin-guanine dinucleotide biosynthesis protein A
MQRDKAALAYHGKPQLQWAYELLSQHCVATFVSVRADQREDEIRAKYPLITDQGGNGPIAGIHAALEAHPKAAWLVIACDLPLLTESTLHRLIAQRDPTRIATAYKSSHDGLPEPLCAIWEPASRSVVAAWIAAGKDCPRKLLINSEIRLLDAPEARALDNVNTPEDLAAITKFRQLRVQYFALFREQAGRKEELVETRATTPRELYSELKGRYPFQLAEHQLKVAVNTEFAAWDRALADGDTVVFIPPVAGG